MARVLQSGSQGSAGVHGTKGTEASFQMDTKLAFSRRWGGGGGLTDLLLMVLTSLSVDRITLHCHQLSVIYRVVKELRSWGSPERGSPAGDVLFSMRDTWGSFWLISNFLTDSRV